MSHEADQELARLIKYRKKYLEAYKTLLHRYERKQPKKKIVDAYYDATLDNLGFIKVLSDSIKEKPTLFTVQDIIMLAQEKIDGLKEKRKKVEQKEQKKKDIEKKKAKKKEDENTRRVSFLETKEVILEQIYDGTQSMYAVYQKKNEQIYYTHKYTLDGIIYKPCYGEEISKQAILLPAKAEEYGTDKELDDEIKKFINTWLDIPPDVLQFAVWNIKRSWVFQKFHTLNYLRALGDTGSGKTRFLDTLGALHYKSISTSGASTSAPVFRVINKWRGTLVMDEADFQRSDESQDIIKIINQGYERGKHIMRCDQDDINKIGFFDPFCPKIIATRKTFYDKAVESRCITQVMKGTTDMNIPVNLNQSFFDTAQVLRNKLLMWRFHNYDSINPTTHTDIDMSEIEPRVRQIVSSFISLFKNDKEQLRVFKTFINTHQANLIDERRNTFAGEVVGAIHKLLENEHVYITSQDIIETGGLTNMRGQPMHPRSLSSILKSLGFENLVVKKIDGVTKRVLNVTNRNDRNFLADLFRRYGFEVTKVTKVRVPMVELPLKNNNSMSKNQYTKELNQYSEEYIKDELPKKNNTTPPSPNNNRNLRNLRNPRDDILEFLAHNPKDNHQTSIQKYGAETIQKMLEEGEIMETKPGTLTKI